MTEIFYTGIGSRETPAPVLAVMSRLGFELAELGWTLRSGGADGADTAFEVGADRSARCSKEIYLPWARFNGSDSPLYNTPPEAFEWAKRAHPAWHRLKPSAQKLHARNVRQVLGQDLKTPSHLVICWTKGGEQVGGTATALRIAEHHRIPIINLGAPHGAAATFKRVLEEAKRQVNIELELRTRRASCGPA